MKIALGYLLGIHLLSPNLNNSHPLMEINESVLVYQNSFEKTAIAAYKTFQDGDFKLRLGLTTGYYRTQEYKDYIYNIPTATDNGVALFAAPSYEKNGFVLAILGDSINAGYVFQIK